MKPNRVIVSVVPCVLLAFGGPALAQTTNDWQFSSFGSGPPSSVTNTPTTATSINPFGGTALAIVVGPNNTYYFGAGSGGPNGVFGPPTGLWDVQGGGQIQLSLDRTSASPVDFTVVITEFADRSFYPGTISFSLPGAVHVGETVVVPQTGNMTGSWYAETYQWSQVNLGGNAITLDITPDTSVPGAALLIDDVQFSITGTLTVVPEPAFSSLAVAGLLAFSMRYWSQRKARRSLSSAR